MKPDAKRNGLNHKQHLTAEKRLSLHFTLKTASLQIILMHIHEVNHRNIFCEWPLNDIMLNLHGFFLVFFVCLFVCLFVFVFVFLQLTYFELTNRLIVLMTQDNSRGLYQFLELNVHRSTAKTTIFSTRKSRGYKKIVYNAPCLSSITVG